MFESQPKRHPLQTFQFWFLICLCLVGVAAWQMGMITLPEFVDSHSTEIHEEEMPPPPAGGDAKPFSQLGASSPFAPLQGESNPEFEQQTQSPYYQRSEITAENVVAPPVPDQVSTGNSQRLPNQSTNQIELASATFAPERSQIENAFTSSAATDPDATATTSSQLTATTSPPRLQTPQDRQPLDFREVDALAQAGDDVGALRQISIWYWERPQDRHLLEERLTALSGRVFFRPHPHYVEPYTVSFGDRLESIAKEYQVPWEYLAKVNRTQPEKIRPGQKLKVIRGPFGVVVDLSDMELTVHAHGYYAVQMPIGIGKDESTPIGTFRVKDKVVNPIYYGPDEVVAADDPANPLGEYWIAFSDENGSLQGFGIHGTIDPATIGKAESRGCVRLHDQDIEDLYHLLTIGSEIVIRR